MLLVEIISGFTQREGQWNGMHELRELCLAELTDYSPMSVRVEYRGWDSRWKDIARQIHLTRLRYRSEPFSLVVFAYSWGVGNGLAKLLRELDRYGIKVSVAVIADGAYHHWWNFLLAQWRVVFSRWRINLDVKNLVEVHGFYQEVSWPVVSEPICAEGVLKSWTPLELPHIEMDDSPDFHAKCIEVIRQQVQRVVRSTASMPVAAPSPQAVVEEAAAVPGPPPLKSPPAQFQRLPPLKWTVPELIRNTLHGLPTFPPEARQ